MVEIHLQQLELILGHHHMMVQLVCQIMVNTFILEVIIRYDYGNTWTAFTNIPYWNTTSTQSLGCDSSGKIVSALWNSTSPYPATGYYSSNYGKTWISYYVGPHKR